MILLDAVESYSKEQIVCLTESHRRADNPLRCAGELPAFALIEYAAQAMAVHGALNGSGEARAGVLGSVRDVFVHVGRVDDLAVPLRVCASLRLGEPSRAVYMFSIQSEGREIASGQATVFFLDR